MGSPYLFRIFIYPIKSLDPIEVESVKISEKGALEGDRVFALFDEENRVVNAKREKKLHLVRSFVDFEKEIFEFSLGGEKYTFGFDEIERVNEFFSEFLGYRVFMKKNEKGGFPDDTKASGPTIVSRSTLREVASWFNISEEEARRRFRANIEIEGVPPFWEDYLVGKKFKIGDVEIEGVNISKRCPVPTRNPYTGEPMKNFVKIFTEKRKEKTPPDVPREIFDTYYRLCLNTNIPESEWGKILRKGDKVQF